MPTCNYCGTTILFGGKKAGDLRFCNNKCLSNGSSLIVSNNVPREIVVEKTKEVYRGLCPKCGKNNGPIDVHTSHYVWSLLVMTSWSSKPAVSCGSCGAKSQILGLFSSLLLGWWGFPWGFLVTPVQVVRNFVGLVYRPNTGAPSQRLEQLVKLQLAQNMIAEPEEDLQAGSNA